jgi:outer membrane protein TolC
MIRLLITCCIAISCCTSLPLLSQELTLDSAYQLARRNYPLIRQGALINQTAALTIENISKGFLPQVSINAQGSYQSDVTRIDVPLPGFAVSPLSKDQYRVTADVSQLVYDGGLTRQQQLLQLLTSETEQQKLEVELYRLRDRINQLFMGILLTDEQVKQTALVRSDIAAGLRRTRAQVQNGTAFRSAVSGLMADSIKNEQRTIELTANRKSLVAILSVFLGKELSPAITLQMPQAPKLDTRIARPELSLYDSQEKLISIQNNLITAKSLPRTSLFAQGGYGRPGLNMLKNNFDLFYVAGVRFNWQLSNFYTAHNDRRLVDINKRNIELQRETFLQNTQSQLVQQQADIDKLRSLVSTDEQIIALRKTVKDAALAQLENGVITSTDYVREVNAEDQARQSLIAHQLQLLLAQINYQTITGK